MSPIAHILKPVLTLAEEHVNSDPDFQASAADTECTFAVASSDDNDSAVSVSIANKKARLAIGPLDQAIFVLQARTEDWTGFFSKDLVRPYQSYWGIQRVLGHHDGVAIMGDKRAFGQYARIWRIVLDRMRDAVHGRPVQRSLPQPPTGEELEEDAIMGKYTWIDHSDYGKVKIFYEFAGSGPQAILFLHTAGSDSRQTHLLMNNAELQRRCTMYAFDLPAHGRSGLGSKQSPENYALTEESYLECIGKMIRKLKLQRTILCGASMAGHVCLAAAIQARELDVHGVIACEGCDHLPSAASIYSVGGNDASMLDPEKVCGMCAPMSPEYYKRQIWWQYSSQGYGIFSGDLKFYFKGWDGRGRVETIDTAFCPVYMLTGEYDYSCTTEASKATAEKIPGAVFEPMKGLGHFPLTENPERVLPYLLRALDHITAQQR